MSYSRSSSSLLALAALAALATAVGPSCRPEAAPNRAGFDSGRRRKRRRGTADCSRVRGRCRWKKRNDERTSQRRLKLKRKKR